MIASFYGYRFTSPEPSLLINNEETAAATHGTLTGTHILRSNCMIKWTFNIECALLI